MVHVDDVPRGLECQCRCPYCHEPLMARHGDVREHGFAHHSDTREANLKICYMVTLYKLAEQIIQETKTVRAPSYYEIYKSEDLHFADVRIDSEHERVDKQPDVIATTIEGKQYLIEFTFKYKVQHKRSIDYKNLNCLEINLSNQTLDGVRKFLLESEDDRKWLNNQERFDGIEALYKSKGKTIKLVSANDCRKCKNFGEFCARSNNNNIPIIIENSGQTYRLCKTELLEQSIRNQNNNPQYNVKNNNKDNLAAAATTIQFQFERNCFLCENNRSYLNSIYGGFAHCAIPTISGAIVPTPPDTAYTCRCFFFKKQE